MKQVLQFRRSGRTHVVDIPAPMTPPGGLLVRNRWSLISPGTERMLATAGGANLLTTARQRPDLVQQVLDKARREGIAATVEAVRSRIDVAIPLGYSCAGIALDVGPSAAEFRPDDRVACAGAGQANHAEIVAVQKNLAVRVPDAVSLEDAAFVTVGAIALQGVRVADVRVGEACVVIGLGLVGQLVVQLLKAAGCRVFGIDTDQVKVDLALACGADAACQRSDESLLDGVRAFSAGRGADAILVAAAASTSDPIQLAPSLARDRAVVTMVGMTGMDVPRNAYYEKELQVRLSRSYGPGRYDRTYEDQGIDYPIGYVRWTEQRNMEAFLDLVAQRKVDPSRLVTHRFPIAQAERAYQVVTGDIAERYVGILLEYPSSPDADTQTLTRVDVRPAVPVTGTPRLGVIGAGNFARGVLLPIVKKMDVRLAGVATASGPSAQQAASRYGFAYAATDWQHVVRDANVDAVLVATRHDLHARVAAAALRAGKHVFLEKPMALSASELDDLLQAAADSGRVLQVGFNRRFAPTYIRLKQALSRRRAPLAVGYRVNAGQVAAGSWVVDPVQGGGRIVGEACHMVDLVCDLVGAPVNQVYAQPGGAGDDVVLTLGFEDGSLGTILYASGGARALPKERLEVLGGGRSAVLDDFRGLHLYEGGRAVRGAGRLASQDKGHAAELAAFFDAVRRGGPSPVDPAAAAHVTRVTFAALDSLRAGVPVAL
jgi:predicted dehydrogenase/threonine dehydrogenase-like Zn-dependent dehydrogenase